MLLLQYMIYSWFVLSTWIGISFSRMLFWHTHLSFKDWFPSQYLSLFYFFWLTWLYWATVISAVSQLMIPFCFSRPSFLVYPMEWQASIPNPIRQGKAESLFQQCILEIRVRESGRIAFQKEGSHTSLCVNSKIHSSLQKLHIQGR